jgi:tRNA(Arg) A34 adenosine deaminase TadA
MKKRYFDIAKKLSLKSPSRFKLGCVIVNKSRVVALGWNNMNRTHPKARTYGNFLHAEIHALIGTDIRDTKNSIAYVYREDRHGKIAKSRPCQVCFNALKIAGVQRICYTDNNSFIEEKI